MPYDIIYNYELIFVVLVTYTYDTFSYRLDKRVGMNSSSMLKIEPGNHADRAESHGLANNTVTANAVIR